MAKPSPKTKGLENLQETESEQDDTGSQNPSDTVNLPTGSGGSPRRGEDPWTKAGHGEKPGGGYRIISPYTEAWATYLHSPALRVQPQSRLGRTQNAMKQIIGRSVN